MKNKSLACCQDICRGRTGRDSIANAGVLTMQHKLYKIQQILCSLLMSIILTAMFSFPWACQLFMCFPVHLSPAAVQGSAGQGRLG